MRYQYIVLPLYDLDEVAATQTLDEYGTAGYKLVTVEYQRAYLMREVDA